MAKVAVVFGGRSVEHEVSLRSARTVCAALAAAGHEVVAVGIATDGSVHGEAASRDALDGGARRLAPSGVTLPYALARFVELEVDVVFPIVHGSYGEDGRLQGLLEMLDLPYVGCGVTASAIAMDKVVTKALVEAAGVPVVDGVVVARADHDRDPDGVGARVAALGWPVFVKPAAGGSSVGVTKVVGPETLDSALAGALALHPVALVERAVSGREIECAVLGGGVAPVVAATALGEIVPGAEFYDYADKYLTDAAELHAPAVVSEAVASRVRDYAQRAFAAIGGEGLARIDFFVVGDDIYLNEINTLPGFTSISMYPRLWGLEGVELPQLVDRLVSLALDRARARRGEDEALAGFLASLAG